MKAASEHILTVKALNKTYASGFSALKDIHFEIRRGEIFALLGPNGAGKTTLINIICGIVTPTSGAVTVNGFDIIKDYRQTRAKIGLVPQEIATDMSESTLNTVALSRGLFGKAPNPVLIEQILKTLSLWDKRDVMIRRLSGGMKRRVMIAKALAHEPEILFLDEPSAGVDVTLRRDMWEMVRGLRKNGVTIILTTHYIEEAQEMADRIGIINNGKIILIEEKLKLMRTLGKKQLTLSLTERLNGIPETLAKDNLTLTNDGFTLNYTFDTAAEHTGMGELIKRLGELGIEFKDLQTKESSLEDIFVNLTGERA